MEFGIVFIVLLVLFLLVGIWLHVRRVSWRPSKLVLLLFTGWVVLTGILLVMGDWVPRD